MFNIAMRSTKCERQVVIGGELPRSLDRLRRGGPVIICDAENREGEGDLAFAASMCTPTLANFALTIARGLLCVAMLQKQADRIGVTRLRSNNHDPHATPFGMPITFADGSSGISARSRSNTIRRSCDPEAGPGDFYMPGHVATLIAHVDGLAGRDGHTEAVLHMLKLADVPGNGVLCEILAPNGEIAKRDCLIDLAQLYDLPIVTIEECAAFGS
jgi:3,4-dihydroxy 2-butanone 4-phosphate synthase/GTP cyclohydrolase II